jgi:hypothetical protein
MSKQISLKEAERKAFRTAYNDGLWDIMLGAFFLLFAIAPYLSRPLGDFWSSAVFLPFWGAVYLAVRWLRKHVVVPRIGEVEFGPARKARLTRFTSIMVAINLVAFILGVVAAFTATGAAMTIVLGVFFLVTFSMAGYLLDFERLYLYGLLAAASLVAGEWLWRRGYASHHGFPLTFGTTSGIMILVGLILFIRLVHNNPIPDGASTGEA